MNSITALQPQSASQHQRAVPPQSPLLAQVKAATIGLQDAETGFRHAPVSLTPWQLRQQQWQQLQGAANLLGTLLEQIAADRAWLLQHSRQLAHSASVPGDIWRILNHAAQAPSPRQSRGLTPDKMPARHCAINRHDFMLDNSGKWRWVESNPIAAGMGPLNQRWLELMADHSPGQYAANPARQQQAATLAQAATAMATAFGSKRPLLVMAVEASEDNIFDQQMLADAITELGVSVVRLNLAQLLRCELAADHRLYLADGRAVDLLYWRTGYNPADQHTAQAPAAVVPKAVNHAVIDHVAVAGHAPTHDTVVAFPNQNRKTGQAAAEQQAAAIWQFRARLEQSYLVQCPSLAAQLTGSKWLQHMLSQQLHDPKSSQQLAAHFKLIPAQLQLLQQLCLPSFAVADLSFSKLKELLAQGYWYKKQQEGGGNVARFQQALAWYSQHDAADVLMAPINTSVRREWLHKLVDNELIRHNAHISELGIFTLGQHAQYGGYLCRTKAASSLEGGVHRGGAALDLIQLTDEK